ncbi:type IV pilin N-terminal domain-containing protein [uncultured Methanoregula sp.]|uniref:type IV pilin N-terminal domain-containing protein n=1 Tax=uncultured Methanoregula sp. TaxID=1005933 RepID=UPI002AAA8EBA|nr:type IV pilin N-terminal domain-containing protein [uncultured Methanoregula sp.]
MKQRKTVQEHAVSPVVGVMLMLVVTIIIAAVVSAFAGGLSSGTQKAPQASIEVKILSEAGNTMGGTNEYLMTFSQQSGEPISTKDLNIITYYKNKAGKIYKNTQTPTSTPTDLYGYGSTTRVPYISDARLGYSGNNPSKDFGNYSWKVGDVLSTGSSAGTADILAINSTATPHTILDSDFGPGSIVEVKILHVPSGQYIYDREVTVQ